MKLFATIYYTVSTTTGLWEVSQALPCKRKPTINGARRAASIRAGVKPSEVSVCRVECFARA